MFVVHKYPIERGQRTIELPVGSKIIHVEAQHNVPTMWIQKPLNEKVIEDRKFIVYGTGWEIDFQDITHVGSCLCSDGAFVWHIFEVAR